MDNQVLVGELNGFADASKEVELLGLGQLLFAAVAVNGRAVDILHGQIQLAFGGYSAIEQAGYIGMLKSGENLPLHPEAFAEEIGGQRKIDELDGELLLELAISAMREINSTHASAAEESIDLVRADATAVWKRFTDGFTAKPPGSGDLLFCFAGIKQRVYFRDQFPITTAPLLDQRETGFGRQF